MNKDDLQHFSFVNIVSLVFLIIVFVGNFMGLLYILEGNFAFAFVGSVLLTILYLFVIRLLVSYKQKMVDNPFKHGSYLLWIFYLGLAVISMFLLTHFINVEYNVKEEIQQSAYQKIEVLDKGLEVYKNNVKSGLEDFETDFKTKLRDYKDSGDVDLLAELQAKPFSISATFLTNRKFIEVDQTVNRYMGNIYEKTDLDIKEVDSIIKRNNLKFKSTFSNWERLSLMDTYSGLNKYITDSEKFINVKSGNLPFHTDTIKVKFDSSVLPLNQPLALNQRFKPNYLIPIILVLIVHVFLILPFIFEPVRIYSGRKSGNTNEANNSTTHNEHKGPANQSSGSGLNTDF